jgi:O-antigen ligase
VAPAPPAGWPRVPEAAVVTAVADAMPQPATEAAPFGGPFHLFCLLTFVIIGRPNDYFLFLVPFRIALVFTVLTAVVTLLQPKKAGPSPFSVPETKLYLIFYAVMVAGIPFATYRPGAFEQVIMAYPVNVVFFLTFLVHVDSLAKMKRVAGIVVVSVLIFNFFGFASGEFMSGRYVTGSRMFDPNDVAFVEVSLLGFALWVLVGRFGVLMKAAALATVVTGVLLTLFTASRGGLLGLTTFLLLFLCLRVPTVSKPFKTVLFAILMVGAFMNADKINLERYETLGSLENDYNLEEGGRVDIWKRGMREFWENPLTGVGVNGFAPAVGWQRADEGISGKWQTAHSVYVQVLVETGIVGGTAFVLLILISLRTFNRMRRAAGLLPERELAVLPGILLVSFGAQLVAALFLSQAYSMFFTLVFAMSGALNLMAANATTSKGVTAATAGPVAR